MSSALESPLRNCHSSGGNLRVIIILEKGRVPSPGYARRVISLYSITDINVIDSSLPPRLQDGKKTNVKLIHSNMAFLEEATG